MSDATPAAEPPEGAKLRKYLTFMLNASPQAESERIVSARMKAMRLVEEKPREVSAAQDAQENLLETKAKLEELRAGIWEQPVEAMQPELQALAAKAPAHLQPLVQRLQLILASRPQLEGLVTGEKTQYEMDPDFLTVFKQVLNSNPQERAELRERAVMAFRDRHLPKHGRKTLKHLQANLPTLCALEEEWIVRLKMQPPKWSKLNDLLERLTKEENEGWFYLGMIISGVLIYLAIRWMFGLE